MRVHAFVFVCFRFSCCLLLLLRILLNKHSEIKKKMCVRVCARARSCVHVREAKKCFKCVNVGACVHNLVRFSASMNMRQCSGKHPQTHPSALINIISDPFLPPTTGTITRTSEVRPELVLGNFG